TTYLASLYAPINSLTQTWGLIQGARVGAERVFEILETAPDLADGTRDLARADVHGAVTFEGVHFGYEAGRPVLRGVDFHARAGVRARRDHGGPGDARSRAARRGPDDVRHRAPAVHGPARGRDRRPGRRPHRRAGHVRGAHRARRSFRAPAPDAVRRGRGACRVVLRSSSSGSSASTRWAACRGRRSTTCSA